MIKDLGSLGSQFFSWSECVFRRHLIPSDCHVGTEAWGSGMLIALGYLVLIALSHIFVFN